MCPVRVDFGVVGELDKALVHLSSSRGLQWHRCQRPCLCFATFAGAEETGASKQVFGHVSAEGTLSLA